MYFNLCRCVARSGQLLILFLLLFSLSFKSHCLPVPCPKLPTGEVVPEHLRAKGPLVPVVLPMTFEEVMELSHHQLMWVVISLLPFVEMHFGDMSMKAALKLERDHHGGLEWLQKTSLAVYAITDAIMSTRVGDETRSIGVAGAGPYWETDTRFPDSEIKKINHALVHIKIIDSPAWRQAEVDSVIHYTNLLLKKDGGSLNAQQSNDNRASLTPVRWDPEYALYELSLTSPFGFNHTYSIKHESGCNSLLARDGDFLIENREVMVWTERDLSGLSRVSFEHPAAVDVQPSALEIPREFVSLAVSQAVTMTAEPLIEWLLQEFPVYFTIKITPEMMKEFSYRTPNSKPLQATEPSRELVRVPDIEQELVELLVEHNIHWQQLSLKQLQILQGALLQGTIGAMQGSGKGPSGSPPNNGQPDGDKDKERQAVKPQKSADDSDENSSNGDQPEPHQEKYSIDTALSEGRSLIEAVATKRIMHFAHNTSSTLPKKVDAEFIKSLSRAGMAQVVIKEGAHPSDAIMAISKTLVKFLLVQADDFPEGQKPDWFTPLEKQSKDDGYYLELNQRIYDLMLEHFDKLAELARLRQVIQQHFIQNLENYVGYRNQMYQTSAYQYALIGGEAVRAIIRQAPLSRLKDNLIITDDIDVLMNVGTLEDFLKTFTPAVADRAISWNGASTPQFIFPCGASLCRFNLAKFVVRDDWAEFLPSLDVSFPADPTAVAYLESPLSMMSASFGWALQYCYWKRDKYVDRIMLLKELLPNYFGVQYAYLKGVLYPRLEAERKRLKDDLSKKNQEYTELKSKAEKLYRELQELQRQHSNEEELDELRGNIEQELGERFQAEHEAALAKAEQSRQELEDRLQEVLAEQDRLKQQLGEEIAQREAVQEELEAETLAGQSAFEQLKAARSEEAKAKTEYERLKAENILLSDESDAAKARAEKFSKRAKELKDKHEQSQSRLKKAKAMVEEKDRDFAELNIEKNRLEEEAEAYREAIRENHDARESMKNDIAAINKKLSRMALSLTEAQDEHIRNTEQQNERIQALVRDNQALADEKQTLEKDNDFYLKLAIATEVDMNANAARAERYRVSRNRMIYLAYTPAFVLLFREAVWWYWGTGQDAICRRFKHPVVIEFCHRNRVQEQTMLNRLAAIDRFPLNTSVPHYDKLVRFSYTEEEKMQLSGATEDQLKPLNILVPSHLTRLDELFLSELEQSLATSKKVDKFNDSTELLQQFTANNLMLCGIMRDDEQQHRCAEAVAASMRQTSSWPCRSDLVASHSSACEKVIYGTLTKDYGTNRLYGMLPSWRVDEGGHFEWHDAWPVTINKHGFKRLRNAKPYTHHIKYRKLCTHDSILISRFAKYQWVVKRKQCSSLQLVYSELEHANLEVRPYFMASWVESSDHKEDQFISSQYGDSLKPAWH